jgi:hypothetical protein
MTSVALLEALSKSRHCLIPSIHLSICTEDTVWKQLTGFLGSERWWVVLQYSDGEILRSRRQVLHSK